MDINLKDKEHEKFWRQFRWLSYAVRNGVDPEVYPDGLDTLKNISNEMVDFLHSWVQEGHLLESYHIAAVALLFDFWKGRSYGDSWQKRGEAISIFGNICRKFDRLDNHFTRGHDLSGLAKVDAVTDLAVYCLKYSAWLAKKDPAPFFQMIHNLADETFYKEKNVSAQDENPKDAKDLGGYGRPADAPNPFGHISSTKEAERENHGGGGRAVYYPPLPKKEDLGLSSSKGSSDSSREAEEEKGG